MYPVPLVDEESARRGEELGVGFALRGAGAEVRTGGVVLVLVFTCIRCEMMLLGILGTVVRGG